MASESASDHSPVLALGDEENRSKIAPDVATFRLEKTPSDKPSGSGYGYSPPVAGTKATHLVGGLPEFDKVQWEGKTDGSIEAWQAPNGSKSPRKEKTYMGRVGKRLFAKWEAMPPDELRAVVAGWIADRRQEKGIV